MYFHFILIITLGIRFLYSHYAEKEIESLMFNKLSRAIQLVGGRDRFLKWSAPAPNPTLSPFHCGGQPGFLSSYSLASSLSTESHGTHPSFGYPRIIVPLPTYDTSSVSLKFCISVN